MEQIVLVLSLWELCCSHAHVAFVSPRARQGCCSSAGSFMRAPRFPRAIPSSVGYLHSSSAQLVRPRYQTSAEAAEHSLLIPSNIQLRKPTPQTWYAPPRAQPRLPTHRHYISAKTP